jgi:predicted metal-dependent hydrolase
MSPAKRSIRLQEDNCSLQTEQGPITYSLKKSSHRRTLSICITEKADIVVSAPLRAQEDFIRKFIQEKSSWILDKVVEMRERKTQIDGKSFSEGARFLFLGKEAEIIVKEDEISRSQIEFYEGQWTITVPKDLSTEDRNVLVKEKMIDWYRREAKEILGGRIFHFSRVMNVMPERIEIRTQKRIWGNCDYRRQRIHLNWQLIQAPMDVIDYVVVHELCHLTVPNHSKRFWKKVASFMPEFNKQRQWLKANHINMILPL